MAAKLGPSIFSLPTSSSAPGSPAEGDMYYNTTDDKVYVYNGSAFVSVGGDGTFPNMLSTGYTFNGSGMLDQGSSKISHWSYAAIADTNDVISSSTFGWHDDGGVGNYPMYWAVYMDGASYAVNKLVISIHSNSIGNFKLQGSNNSNTSGTFYNTGTWTNLTFNSTKSTLSSQNGGGNGSGYIDGTELTFIYDNDTQYTHYRIQVDDNSTPGNSGGNSGFADFWIELSRI